MISRWELFNQLLVVAVLKSGVDWVTAVRIVKDVQDTNIKYKIDSTTDADAGRELGDMVIAYLKWKSEGGSKPDWFIKSGE